MGKPSYQIKDTGPSRYKTKKIQKIPKLQIGTYIN